MPKSSLSEIDCYSIQNAHFLINNNRSFMDISNETTLNLISTLILACMTNKWIKFNPTIDLAKKVLECTWCKIASGALFSFYIQISSFCSHLNFSFTPYFLIFIILFCYFLIVIILFIFLYIWAMLYSPFFYNSNLLTQMRWQPGKLILNIYIYIFGKSIKNLVEYIIVSKEKIWQLPHQLDKKFKLFSIFLIYIYIYYIICLSTKKRKKINVLDEYVGLISYMHLTWELSSNKGS